MQFLIAQWLHWLQLFFSRKAATAAVADRLQYMCDWGFSQFNERNALKKLAVEKYALSEVFWL